VEPDGHMGMAFFDGPRPGAMLNCPGEVYRARSLRLPRLSCSANGETVMAIP